MFEWVILVHIAFIFTIEIPIDNKMLPNTYLF